MWKTPKALSGSRECAKKGWCFYDDTRPLLIKVFSVFQIAPLNMQQIQEMIENEIIPLLVISRSVIFLIWLGGWLMLKSHLPNLLPPFI